MSPSHPARRGFTLVELLVVIGIIGMLISLLLPAVQAARESGRRTRCKSNLHNIALALHVYHDSNNRFPPGYGQSDIQDVNQHVGFSWGSYVLPYLEQTGLRNRQLTTRAVTAARLEIWECPSDGELVRRRQACWNDATLGSQNGGECTGTTTPGVNPGSFNNDPAGCGANGGNWRPTFGNPSFVCNGFAAMGSYVGNFGSRASLGVNSGSVAIDGGGVFYANSRITLGQVTDGTSYTWLAGERNTAVGHVAWEAVHWERSASGFGRFSQGTTTQSQTGRFVLGAAGAGAPNASGSPIAPTEPFSGTWAAGATGSPRI